MNEEPAELSEDYSEEFKTLIKKSLIKNSKERPTAIELSLLVPVSIMNSYSLPKQPNLSSLTFMNPTKSTMGRQKSTSKRDEGMDTIKATKVKKAKFKTPKRVSNHTEYSNAYTSHQTSWLKKTPAPVSLEEKKSAIAKLGDLRMREKPYERLSDMISKKYSLSGTSTTDDSHGLSRVSRIRDICKLQKESIPVVTKL